MHGQTICERSSEAKGKGHLKEELTLLNKPALVLPSFARYAETADD